MLKHLLVALDGSERAEQAIPIAIEMASSATQITLIHVLQLPTTPFPISPSPPALPQETEDYALSRQRKQESAHEYLKDIAQRFDGHSDKIELALITGDDSASKLVEFAEKNAVDMIIITTRGHSGVKRWLLGSVTQEVLQAAACPVLVVPTK
ncbi:MAG: universal stress protein [Anaerolineae bacterium]